MGLPRFLRLHMQYGQFLGLAQHRICCRPPTPYYASTTRFCGEADTACPATTTCPVLLDFQNFRAGSTPIALMA